MPIRRSNSEAASIDDPPRQPTILKRWRQHILLVGLFEDTSRALTNGRNVNLNNSYERVPFDMIVDVKMKEREEQQAKSDLEKRIKEERRVVKKAETKVKRNEAAKRRRIEKKAKDALNADEEEEDAEEKEDDDKNADEGEENDDNEAVDEADDEKNQSKSTTRSTRSMSTIKINPNRRSPRNKTKQN
mmetsp:Transcript_13484/g.13269  ORF Transcript_13484/g.13269 Transcript_13484/m.13269 type:complete len:188 (+) Transcript_13484:34-597(+)